MTIFFKGVVNSLTSKISCFLSADWLCSGFLVEFKDQVQPLHHYQLTLDRPMKSQLVVTLLLLVCSVLADTITTSNIDFAGTYHGDMSNLLTRVEKKAKITYDYVLSAANSWTQFPDMGIYFELEFPQYVLIKYLIGTMTGGGNFFCTRAFIDSVQDTDFRVVTGDTFYHTNSASEEVWLSQGKHFVKVQYRMPSNRLIPYSYDYTTSFFKVRYFKK